MLQVSPPEYEPEPEPEHVLNNKNFEHYKTIIKNLRKYYNVKLFGKQFRNPSRYIMFTESNFILQGSVHCLTTITIIISSCI